MANQSAKLQARIGKPGIERPASPEVGPKTVSSAPRGHPKVQYSLCKLIPDSRGRSVPDSAIAAQARLFLDGQCSFISQVSAQTPPKPARTLMRTNQRLLSLLPLVVLQKRSSAPSGKGSQSALVVMEPQVVVVHSQRGEPLFRGFKQFNARRRRFSIGVQTIEAALLFGIQRSP